MRIALVSQTYPPTASGGIATQTWLKACGLAALGHAVEVVSMSPDAQVHETLDDQVRLTRIPAFSSRLPVYEPAVEWLTYSAEVAAALWRIHSQRRLDLIDFPEWAAEGYVHLLNRSQPARPATVIQLHGPLVMFAKALHWPDQDSEFYRVGALMEGTCLRLADAIYSSSRCSADWVRREYGLNDRPIPLIHTGVNLREFHPHRAPKASRPTIIFTGKVVANKGVFLLAEAACELAPEFPGLQLRLLGRVEEPTGQQLRALAATAGRPDLIDLPGFVERSALPDQLARAHVFAAPSEYEGGPGFVYLEAMACGLPVIACSGSGAAEVVQPGENGWLVPPRDRPALVQTLRRLLSDAAEREALGERARRYVEREADSTVCLRKLEAFYRTVAANSRSA